MRGLTNIDQSCREYTTLADYELKRKNCDERIAKENCGRSELECLGCEYYTPDYTPLEE